MFIMGRRVEISNNFIPR